jgi:subtilisin family serine protease
VTRWLARYLVAALVAGLVLIVPQASANAAPGPADAPEWWFDSWQVSALWAAGARGQGITIAEIDTGVNAALPELAANILPGYDFGNPALNGQTDDEIDQFGHGTAMASLMVAHPGTAGITGLAPDAKILPIAVPLDGTTYAVSSKSDDVNEAITYAADHGAKIISLSLGGARTKDDGGLPCPAGEQDAITHAIEKGAVVVAASGNGGRLNGSGPQPDSQVEDPAVCLGVVSVGAVDKNDQVPNFSSRHKFLTITAPGVLIPTLSRVPGIAYKGGGTSQATAITSAALALIWSKYPTQTGRQIVARMLATLDHSTTGHDSAYGYGIINLQRAITAAVPATAAASNPVFAPLDPFIARKTAADAPLSLPSAAPAANHPVPVTNAIVDSPPGSLTGKVLTGIFIAIGGLVVFLVLGLYGILRWRARRRRPPAITGIPYAALAYPAAPVGRNGRPEPAASVPDSGVVWHDVTDIEPSSPFKRAKTSKS